MYCPNCGDGRATENRFCPRCGFRLDGVTELLAHQGVPYGVPSSSPAAEPGKPSPRRKGMRQGAKVMFLSGVLLPIFSAIAIIDDQPGPLLVPLAVFLLGLARTLYARLFYEDYAATATQASRLPAARQPSDAPRADTTNRLAQASDARSPRRKGMKQGAKIMFLSGVLLPIFGGISIAADDGGPMLAPLAVFMVGLFWTLYHRLFSDDTAPMVAPVTAPPQMVSAYRPPMHSLEAPSPTPTDALHPPSVLEHTTRNLESIPRPSQSQTPQN